MAKKNEKEPTLRAVGGDEDLQRALVALSKKAGLKEPYPKTVQELLDHLPLLHPSAMSKSLTSEQVSAILGRETLLKKVDAIEKQNPELFQDEITLFDSKRPQTIELEGVDWNSVGRYLSHVQQDIIEPGGVRAHKLFKVVWKDFLEVSGFGITQKKLRDVLFPNKIKSSQDKRE